VRWPGRASDAERFARAVDAADTADSEVAPLVTVAQRVRAIDGAADPDPAFTARLRERLVSTATAEWAAAAARAPAPRRWQRTRYALAGALATVLAVTGLVLASRSALPGDALYPIKRGTERVEVTFTFGDQAKGHRYLGMARTRVEEVRGLLERSRVDARTVSSTLDAMDGETATGTRLLTTAAVRDRAPAPLDDLATWTADQRGLLTGLLDRLPAPARTRAVESLDLLRRVAERDAALLAQLSCACLTGGAADDLGPRPCSPCAVAPAGSSSPGAGASTGLSGGAGGPGGSGSPGAGGSAPATGGPAPTGSPPGGGGLPLPLPTGSGGLPLPTQLPTTLPTLSVPPLPLPTTLPSLPLPSLPLPSLSLTSLPITLPPPLPH
jgi:uncharacterized membrane protein YgcG